MSRPTVRTTRNYKWLTPGGQALHGVALMGDRGILAHLTYDEALKVANDIADLLATHRNQEQHHG